MDILRRARELEAGIARVVDGAARTAMKPGALEPLEIVHAVVGKAVAAIQPAGRGRHVFPFNRIKVSVLAPSREARLGLIAVFESAPSLTERITERLHAAGCEVVDLVVRVVYLPAAQTSWTSPQWHVDLSRVAAVPAAPPPAARAVIQPGIELTIVIGSGAAGAATFAQARIDLGRCVEVRDDRHRLLRTNHVAFFDEAGHAVNQSVSRRHAHIVFSEDSGDYRIHDDRSGHGTSLLRNGRAIAVPPGTRGIRLRSGDEILLGEGRVKVKIAASDGRTPFEAGSD